MPPNFSRPNGDRPSSQSNSRRKPSRHQTDTLADNRLQTERRWRHISPGNLLTPRANPARKAGDNGMLTTVLEKLLTDARQNGWSTTTDASLADLALEAERYKRGLSFTHVRNRPTSPPIEVLTPTSSDNAPARSLSAMHGEGPQPLHTDGAHHQVPPHIVLLSSRQISSVATWLWRFDTAQLPSTSMHHDLLHGVFTVRSGRSCFLSPAWTHREQLRYDPGCMEPADDRAQRVATFLNSRIEHGTAFSWTTPGQVLAIDNRRVTHARGDAVNEPHRTIERLALLVNDWSGVNKPPLRRGLPIS